MPQPQSNQEGSIESGPDNPSMVSVVVLGSPLTTPDASFKPCSVAYNISNSHLHDVVREAKSADIENFLNNSVDPCENFYHFVCGSFNGLKSSLYEKSAQHRLKTEMDKEIIAILSKDEASDMEVDLKIKHFFQSCLNVKADFKAYQGKLLDIVAEFGEMPALEGHKWNESNFDWVKTVAEISFKYDISLIMAYKMKYHGEKTNLRLLTPPFGLGARSLYFEKEHQKGRATYQEHIAFHLRKFLGLEANHSEEIAKELFDFETALVNATERRRGRLLNMQAMEEKYQHLLQVENFLNISLGFIPEGDIYDALDYIPERLQAVLENTSKRTMANFVFYNLLKHFMVDPSYAHESCLPKTHKYFSKNIRVIHNGKYLTKEVEESIQAMWHSIKSMFLKDLEAGKHNWLEKNAQKFALEKLEAMNLEIRSFRNTDFTEDLKSLNVNANDFIDNLKAILEMNALLSRQDGNHGAYDANFYRTFYPIYYPWENKIIVPASLLKPNFMWSQYYPMALRFGTLGIFIAHQLIHGFDEDGHSYDKHGNELKWWNNATIARYNTSANCFAQQYAQYNYQGEALPVLSSQQENIADNGALGLAYRAYLQWLESCSVQESQESLPNLDYNNRQLFFIAYGQTRCSTSLDFFDDYATTENTVPDDFRVIVPLTNFAEFANQFRCQIGSSMNPLKKCEMF
uniref:Peptidase M13 C-terminal domain-containing protein n=1 Tax=Stomoxys calcitrans TaxID=35570 RepID=A0A1I8PF71_STOCA